MVNYLTINQGLKYFKFSQNLVTAQVKPIATQISKNRIISDLNLHTESYVYPVRVVELCGNQVKPVERRFFPLTNIRHRFVYLKLRLR